jgi:DNA polymerase III alpha subunit
MKLRVGLSYIKYVGEVSSKCKEIPENATIDDMVKLKVGNKRVLESLTKAGALDHIGGRKEILSSLLQVEENIEKYKQKIIDCEQRIIELTEENQRRKDKTAKAYRKNIDMIINRKKDIVKAKDKLKETYKEQEMLKKYDEAAGECEVLSFSFKEIPKVKLGKLTNISRIKDRNKHDMAFLTMKSDYGEYQCTVFANGWKLIADKVTVGESYKFVVGDTGILEELKVNGEVIKLNERKFWKKR